MLIPTQQIKGFAKRTCYMSENKILPIFDYLLLEIEGNTCYLTKTNLSTFCKYSFPLEHEDCKMLLDEKILFNLANLSESIDVTQSGQIVTLKGKLKQLFSVPDVTDFPVFPEYETTNAAILTKDILTSIGIAVKYSDPKNVIWQHVYSTDNDICGTDSSCIYNKQFDNIPNLTLTLECCNIISAFDRLLYFTNDNWDIFEGNNTVYGFKKTEQKPKDYSWLVQSKKTDGFIIDKSDIEIFCSTTLSMSNEGAICQIFENSSNSLRLYFNSPDLNVTNEMICEVHELKTIDTNEPLFNFVAKTVLKALLHDV